MKGGIKMPKSRIDKIKQYINIELDVMKSQCKGWENDVDFVIESYCRADKIKASTALTNVCNIVNHAGEIKAYKRAIESLETVLRFVESLTGDDDEVSGYAPKNDAEARNE